LLVGSLRQLNCCADYFEKKIVRLACDLQAGAGMKLNQLESLLDKLSRKPFVVQYARTRYLAYRDAAGKVRHFWKQTLLPQSVLILDPED
jgi:hypothetical protein